MDTKDNNEKPEKEEITDFDFSELQGMSCGIDGCHMPEKVEKKDD